ncbi:MAG: L-lactate dehydrogenase [Candidatus Hydrogenedentota bacterium]
MGSTFSYALAQSGLVSEIALVDKNERLAQGQILDLSHGRPYYPSLSLHVGTVADYADASVIVITAGAAQQPGESRLDLLKKNAAIVSTIMSDIVGQGSSAVVIVVSNPVDVLTYVALQQSGWPRGRVIGSGTVLDSARLRYLLSEHCGVDIHNVHAYMLGEHGDSEFAAWSMTHLAGIPIDAYCPACHKCENWMDERKSIEERVRNSAYHIIDYKGATWFGVGMALVRIVEAIVRNQRSVLTVSTRLDGEYGLNGVCLSVPCIVSENGVDEIVDCGLPGDERNLLAASGAVLKAAIAALQHS